MSGIVDRRWKVGALAVVLGLAAAGIAYAFWTGSGTGSGTAATGDVGDVTINQTTTVAGLFPGGPAQPLAGDFDNPNDGGIFVGAIDAAITGVAGPAITGTAPCTAADYTLAGFPVAVGAEVPTGTAVGAWSGGSIQMVNSATNQNGCKGATVTIGYTVVAPVG